MSTKRTSLGYLYEMQGYPKPYVDAIDDIAKRISRSWAQKTEKARRDMRKFQVTKRMPS